LITTVKMMRLPVVVVLAVALSTAARADDAYLQSSCSLDFPEAMAHLQDSIHHAGYRVSRIQHVDKGLIDRGYETDKYKVVFFGKPDQLAQVVGSYPALIPFVPLNITIAREADSTSVSALAPRQYGALGLPADAAALIARWEQDVEAIVRRYASCQVGA